MGHKGFTLTEILISVLIIGILSSAAIAQYGVAVGRARWDTARNILLQIYDAEWRYRSTVSTTNAFLSQTTLIGAAEMTRWREMYIDNPNTTGAAVTYQVAVPGAGFTATATFAGQTQTVNDSKTFTQVWARP